MAFPSQLRQRTPEAPDVLDPFGYFPEIVSRIAGLHSQAELEDASYVFHTPYAELPGGTTIFRVRFTNLRAAAGSITLSVNELSSDPLEPVRTLQTVVVPLRALMHRGGEQVLQVQVRPDRSYAAFGSIYGETDARADAMTVLVERPDEALEQHKGPDTRASGPGGRAVARLVSGEPPTLAEPVSQVCTPEQFDEAAYDRQLQRLGLIKERHSNQWDTVYTLQVLERYGVLRPGARGLGLGDGTDVLAGALREQGCAVSAPSGGTHGVQDVFGEAEGGIRPAAYDFVWGCGLIDHVGSIEAGMRLIEHAIVALRPGGLAVFTLALEPKAGNAQQPRHHRFHIQRGQVERLALTLIALGHEVAQLKYGHGPVVRPPGRGSPDAERPATSLGLIVRRGGASG